MLRRAVARRSLRLVLIMLGVMLVVEMNWKKNPQDSGKFRNVIISGEKLRITRRELQKITRMYKEEAEYLI